MKVALVNASDKGGGAEESVLSLHRALLAAGHHSTVYVGEKKTAEPGVIQIPYVRGIPGGRRLARRVEQKTGWQDMYNPSFRNLEKIIPADTDVIHFNNLWGSGGYADIGILPRLTSKIPGVLTERQGWFFTGHCGCFFDCERWKTGCGDCPRLDIPPAIPKDGTKFNWHRKRRVIEKSDVTFVGISDYICDLARQSPIWAGKTIERIYNGINTDVFCPADGDRKKDLREKFGIPGGKVAVLLTGQTLNGYPRGIATEGFQAINNLNDSRMIPVLVGGRAREAQENLSTDSIVINQRNVPLEMAECYQACDITLVASHVEAFGRIAAESQACGVPVVAFDTGGLVEVVKDGAGGISVSMKDLSALMDGLKRFVGSSALRVEYGERAVTYVKENFDERLVAEQYIDLYQQVRRRFSYE